MFSLENFKNIDEIITKNTDVSKKFVDSTEEYRNRLNRIKETLIPNANKEYKEKNVCQYDESVFISKYVLFFILLHKLFSFWIKQIECDDKEGVWN